VSLTRLWLFLAVALPVLASIVASMSTVDLAYQLRAGAEILDDLAIPTVDTWTFTAAGRPWVDQQWGAQIILSLAERGGSWTGLVLLRASLTGIIFGCLALIARRHGLSARSVALLVLAALVVAAPAMALRPQLLGMACFAVVLVLIDGRRSHPRALWLVPVVVAVWANLHGSFFLGPVALGLTLLADVHDRDAGRHRTLLVAGISLISTCLTPFGPWVWAYAFGLSANPEVTARITEWQPTVIRDVTGAIFFASVAGVVTLLARRGARTSWPTLAWLAVFLVIGLWAQRGIAWWPLAAVVAVAPLLGSFQPMRAAEEPTRLRQLNGLLAAGLALIGIALLPMWRPLEPGTGAPAGVLDHAPAGITAELRGRIAPGDRILNPQVWGSWFEYAVPAAQYAVDSRIELFAAETWEQYAALNNGSAGWQAALHDWDPDVIVVLSDMTSMAERLEKSGWTRSFTDTDGIILERR
jgi:hypothetical protein